MKGRKVLICALISLILTSLLSPAFAMDAEERPDISVQEKVAGDFEAGMVGGAGYALVNGVIGVAVEQLRGMEIAPMPASSGGCHWEGTAPFCRGKCPEGYDVTREENGRKSNWWFASGNEQMDESFGSNCSTLFGGYFKKRFCCRSNSVACSWAGRWDSSRSGNMLQCLFTDAGKCGQITCMANNEKINAKESFNYFLPINGQTCDVLQHKNWTGRAACGVIQWKDNDGKLVDVWYKSK